MKILFLLPLLLLLSACNADKIFGLSVPTRIPIQNSNHTNCPKWDSGKTIKITEDTIIPSGCAYDRVTFTISQSNITFDCNGAELNGLGKTKANKIGRRYKVAEAPRNTAFSIGGSENNLLQNITVKNCRLIFYINGFNIGFALNKTTHDDLKNGRNIEALENYLRTVSPKNIRIENNEIIRSHKAGIFVQRYVTDMTIDNNTINRAGDIGIYLESGTQKITIVNSEFTKNGEFTYDIEERKRKPRSPREAIAIDSSAHNTIKNNTFENNAGGAIFMYKNCYERYKESNQLPRYQGSDYNLIENNKFLDEVKGVWIASRQSRDLKNFDCGDRALPIVKRNKKKDLKYYEDFAKHNQIINNIFDNVKKAVIVEDDNNIISRNTFKRTKRKDIIIGVEDKVKTLHTVKGTIVRNNTFSSKPGVLLRNNPIDSSFSGNNPPVSIIDSSK